MRRLGALVIAVLATAASAAATASADPPLNYGRCVSTDAVEPSNDPYGPANSTAAIASYPSGGTFWTAILHSDGNARFSDVAWCS